MLENATHGLLPLPQKAGPTGAKVLRGARPWIEAPVQKRGIVDEGILALDLRCVALKRRTRTSDRRNDARLHDHPARRALATSHVAKGRPSRTRSWRP